MIQDLIDNMEREVVYKPKKETNNGMSWIFGGDDENVIDLADEFSGLRST